MKRARQISERVDYHVHVGRFNKNYFDPVITAKELLSLKLSAWYVSSTSTCNAKYDFELILNELLAMDHAAPGCVRPVLWLRPELMTKDWSLARNRGLDWRMLKIHPFIHDWVPNSPQMEAVLDLARTWKVSILIHTGGRAQSEAGYYRQTFLDNPDIPFILAHGKPGDQTLSILKESPNTWMDISFSDPGTTIRPLIEAGFNQRILFGSDYPMDRVFYPRENTAQRYKETKKDLIKEFGKSLVSFWHEEKIFWK